MIHIYQVYIDKLFLLNFVLIFCLLELMSDLLKMPVSHLKICRSAFNSAGVFCLIILIPNLWVSVKIFAGFGVISILVFYYTFSIHNIRKLLKCMMASYITAVLVGGSLSLFFKLTGISFTSMQMIPVIIGITILLKIAVLLLNAQRQKNIYRVRLFVRGTEIQMTALADTGNHLTDPISKKPVCIVQKSVFPKELEFEAQKFRAIPYHAVGTDNGILNGYVMDYLKIELEEGTILILDPVIGICENDLSAKEKYQMILHMKLLNEREEFV